MLNPAQLYNKLNHADPGFYTEDRCRQISSQLERIAELKAQRNAVLLAHSYQRPEVFEAADYVGDSLGLSLEAANITNAEVIVFCGVHFMAETAKVVSPSKTVLLPNMKAGCSLSDTADAEDVASRIEELRKTCDDLGVVTYVNTTAAVKALSDACCTSANSVEVVRSLPQKTILFIPDKNLAQHVANNVPEKEIIAWEGYCYVHHELQPKTIEKIRHEHPDMHVLVHPECRDDVINLADATLSTTGMVKYARESEATQFLAVTECGLSDLLTIQVPEKQFFRACKVCRYMKMITLSNIIESLEKLQPEITLPEDVRVGAELAIRRMFELTSPDNIPVSVIA